MRAALLWLWQSPQHLLALALVKVTGAVHTNTYRKPVECRVYRQGRHKGWGVSLGRYVILHEGYDSWTELHELGHSAQSAMLGPLYLLVIGVPSAVFNNLWDRLAHKKWPREKRLEWYYSRYPEAWADRLGGVSRPWANREGRLNG